MVRWLACALALSAALAGCGGKDAPPPGLPLDEAGDVLPTVEGFVVDEAIRPMVNASVRILGEEVVTATDEGGHYALHRPTFLAEDVLVTAYAPGYVPQSRQVQASGHTSARIDFRLEPDPDRVPRVDVLSHAGVIPCQLRTSGETHPCSPPSVSLDDGLVMPTDTAVWGIDIARGLAGAVLEVHWDAETPLAEVLHAQLRGPVAGGDKGSLGEVQAEATGTRPLRLEVPEEVARAWTPWTALWLEVRLADGQGQSPAAFARAQTFEAYASLFYVDPAPPGYSLA